MTERSGRAAMKMAGIAVVFTAVASGCVSLQANGPITPVAESDEGSSQVQIWPSPPTATESAQEIVTGFLQAARSGSANLAIADDYLTPAMQQFWKQRQNTVIVLADGSQTYPQQAGQGYSGDSSSLQEIPEAGRRNGVVQGVNTAGSGNTVTEQVQGVLLGTVGPAGTYSAASGTDTYSFGLTQQKDGGYRIDSLPGDIGVLMERSDFESSYDRHDVYFQNAQYSGRLIPTQIYLPSIATDQELADAMARLVVQGVPAQLGSAMQNAVQGAQLEGGVQFQGDGSATVTINSHGYCAKYTDACRDLGEQLAASLNGLSTKVTSVTVQDQSSNTPYAPQDASASAGLSSYGASLGSHGSQSFTAIANDGTVEVASTPGVANTSQPPYGPAKTKFRQVAVGPARADNRPQSIALVSQDGTKVYVPHKQDDSTLTTVYASGSLSATVNSLSWDAYGNLWFTVTQNGLTSAYRYGADSSLSQVTIGRLPGKLTQIAAAPDGSRVAVASKDETGDSWISIAAVVSATNGGWLLQPTQNTAADWSQINDFDWYNEDSLAVLGIQPNSQVLGLYQIYADGSSVYDSLTQQPVEAGPPANAQSFVWSSGGVPIAAAVNNGKNSLYSLSVEGQEAQLINGVSGTSPSY